MSRDARAGRLDAALGEVLQPAEIDSIASFQATVQYAQHVTVEQRTLAQPREAGAPAIASAERGSIAAAPSAAGGAAPAIGEVTTAGGVGDRSVDGLDHRGLDFDQLERFIQKLLKHFFRTDHTAERALKFAEHLLRLALRHPSDEGTLAASPASRSDDIATVSPALPDEIAEPQHAHGATAHEPSPHIDESRRVRRSDANRREGRPQTAAHISLHMTGQVRAVILATCLATLAWPGPARGQEFVAGWEGGASHGYLFGSPVFSVDLGANGAIVVRGAVSYLYYGFPDTDGWTNVTSPGASLVVGFRVRTSRLTATFAPGFELRRTRRVVGRARQLAEIERGLIGQGELFFQATPLTQVSAIVSYGDANQYTWARGGIKRQITNTRFERPLALGLGAEVTAQGNHDVRSYQVGGVLEIAFVRARGSLQFRAGYSRLRYRDGSMEARPYLGAGVYRRF